MLEYTEEGAEGEEMKTIILLRRFPVKKRLTNKGRCVVLGRISFFKM